MMAIWQSRGKSSKAVHYGNINNAPLECKPNSKLDPNAPTLAQMTKKAIDLLEVNPNGFFLQVESASIDKQDHKANPCTKLVRPWLSMKPFKLV